MELKPATGAGLQSVITEKILENTAEQDCLKRGIGGKQTCSFSFSGYPDRDAFSQHYHNVRVKQAMIPNG
jgi:hypothetical protein